MPPHWKSPREDQCLIDSVIRHGIISLTNESDLDAAWKKVQDDHKKWGRNIGALKTRFNTYKIAAENFEVTKKLRDALLAALPDPHNSSTADGRAGSSTPVRETGISGGIQNMSLQDGPLNTERKDDSAHSTTVSSGTDPVYQPPTTASGSRPNQNYIVNNIQAGGTVNQQIVASPAANANSEQIEKLRSRVKNCKV